MSYVIYHPGTDTFVSADESYLINVDDLPTDFDDWCFDTAKEAVWFTVVIGEAL